MIQEMETMAELPEEIVLKPIGIIRSPFTRLEGMPIQPCGADGVVGRIEVFPEYQPGLLDLEGFSHITLLYHFHRSQGYDLQTRPFLDDRPHGVFATRAPRRPSGLGLSVVKLTGIENGVLMVENIDVLDETPLLDIKPFVPDFDSPDGCRTGWIEQSQGDARRHRSDDRFAGE
jgi:tRNA-Thr(GGU) m(6)t(6)A37 methyltransferase TsaA